MPSSNELIGIPTAAKKLGTQPQQIYQAIERGKVPVYIEAGYKRVKWGEVQHWYLNRPGIGGRDSGQRVGWHVQAAASYDNSIHGRLAERLASLPKVNFEAGPKKLGAFNCKRTWGLEIEVAGPMVTSSDHYENQLQRAKRSKAQENLTRKLRTMTELPVRVGAKKSDSDMHHWLVQYDASCGLEVVSPPMRGVNGIAHLALMLKALRDDKRKVNTSCGLHVHIDIREFSVSQLRALYTLYYAFEEVLDGLMPPSRRGRTNKQAKSMRLPYFSQIVRAATHDQVIKLFAKHDDVQDDRKYKLNGMSFVTRGTIEFRHHGGTLDTKKAVMWLRLCMAMVDTAADMDNRVPNRATLEDMFEFLQLDQEVRQYYRYRVAELAAAERKTASERRMAARQLEENVSLWAEAWRNDERTTRALIKEHFVRAGFLDVQADAQADSFVSLILRPYLRGNVA